MAAFDDLSGLDIPVNPSGWGPIGDFVSTEFPEMPFAPFSKSERGLGRICDFSQIKSLKGGADVRNRHQFGRGQSDVRLFDGVPGDDEGFVTIDRPISKPKGTWRAPPVLRPYMAGGAAGAGGRGGYTQGGSGQVWNDVPRQQYGNQRDNRRNPRGGMMRDRRTNRNDRVSTRQLEPSVVIRPDWSCITTFDLPFSDKLQYLFQSETKEIVGNGFEGEEVGERVGSVPVYDLALETVRPRKPKSLNPYRGLQPLQHAMEDDIMKDLAAQNVGQVFATDSVIAQLMVASKSIYSWDVIFHRKGDQLWIYPRDKVAFETLTVSETSQEPPEQDVVAFGINSSGELDKEATSINSSFIQGCIKVDKETVKFGEQNLHGFPRGLKYKKFALGKDKPDGVSLDLIVRCEINCIVRKDGQDVPVTLSTLNEFDPKSGDASDWRQKLEQHYSASTLSAIKNNSARIAKVAMQAMICGNELIKIGYVSRTKVTNAQQHEILAVKTTRTAEFIKQLIDSKLPVENKHVWAVVRKMCHTMYADTRIFTSFCISP
jgi:translation initiation factor 3 subunit D